MTEYKGILINGCDAVWKKIETHKLEADNEQEIRCLLYHELTRSIEPEKIRIDKKYGKRKRCDMTLGNESHGAYVELKFCKHRDRTKTLAEWESAAKKLKKWASGNIIPVLIIFATRDYGPQEREYPDLSETLEDFRERYKGKVSIWYYPSDE